MQASTMHPRCPTSPAYVDGMEACTLLTSLTNWAKFRASLQPSPSRPTITFFVVCTWQTMHQRYHFDALKIAQSLPCWEKSLHWQAVGTYWDLPSPQHQPVHPGIQSVGSPQQSWPNLDWASLRHQSSRRLFSYGWMQPRPQLAVKEMLPPSLILTCRTHFEHWLKRTTMMTLPIQLPCRWRHWLSKTNQPQARLRTLCNVRTNYINRWPISKHSCMPTNIRFRGSWRHSGSMPVMQDKDNQRRWLRSSNPPIFFHPTIPVPGIAASYNTKYGRRGCGCGCGHENYAGRAPTSFC